MEIVLFFINFAVLLAVVNSFKGDIYELSAAAGYKAEPHTVVTEDGYILTLFRIVNQSDTANTLSQKEPVLLQHGLLGSAENFFSANEESLAIILSQENFNVWLGNSRGCYYSQKHKTLSNTSKEFWEFTVDQLGKYDLPAMLDYILNLTGRQNISYVGHSQGSGMFFTMTAGDRPSYNKKVKLHVALAPAVYLEHSKATPITIVNVNEPAVRVLAESFGFYQIPSAFSTPAIPLFLHLFCNEGPLAKIICPLMYSLFEPVDQSALDTDYVNTIIDSYPAGMSIYQWLHYAVMAKTGKFSRFDWNPALNLKYYNSLIPATYNLSQVTAPVALIYGENDGIILPENIARLARELPNVIEHYAVPNVLYNHVEFVVGKNLKSLVNNHVMELLNSYRN